MTRGSARRPTQWLVRRHLPPAIWRFCGGGRSEVSRIEDEFDRDPAEAEAKARAEAQAAGFEPIIDPARLRILRARPALSDRDLDSSRCATPIDLSKRWCFGAMHRHLL